MAPRIRGRQQTFSRDEFANLPTDVEIQALIENDNPKALVLSADIIGKHLKNQNVKTSQLRKLFGMVRQIQMNWSDIDSQKAYDSYRQAILLKPKIGYQTQRVWEKNRYQGQGMLILRDAVDAALDSIMNIDEEDEHKLQKRREYFYRLTDFLEAIVAYHKTYGGQES